MFATIRRHQKWLWFIVIVGVIVPFVWFMGPTPMRKTGNRGKFFGGSVIGHINGRPLTHDDYQQAIREIRLTHALQGQERADSDQIMQQVPERLFIYNALREFDIRVSDAAAADWIEKLPVFRDRQRGAFSMERYQQFVAHDLRSLGLNEADFTEFARHEAAITHLATVAGLSGALMPPREAEALFRRDNEQVTTQVALLSVSNHLAEVITTPEALGAFYTNRAASYRVPEMVEVAYVRFAFSNHLAEAAQQMAKLTNMDLQLDGLYRERGPDAFRGPDGKPMTIEAAREAMKKDYLNQMATVAAQAEASQFAEKLYGGFEQQPGRLDLLEQLAASNNLPAAVTLPFAQFSRPPGLPVGQDFTQAAFALSTNQVMATEPVTGQDGVYVIAFKRRTESYLPPFAQREQVVAADYRRVEAMRLAQEKAAKFRNTLTNGLAQGQTFEALCTANNVTSIRPPAFSRSTQSLPSIADHLDVGQLKALTSDLPVGGVSQVETANDGVVIVQVTGREPVSADRIKSELPAFMQSLRNEHRQAALMEWFRREKEMARIDLPEFQESRSKTKK